MSSEHYGTGPVPPGAYAPAPEPPAPIRPEDLASYGRRAAAAVIDTLLLAGLTAGLLAGLGIGFFADGDLSFWGLLGATLLAVVLFAAIALLYAPLVMVATNGQTPGKAVTGCRVVRPDRKPISFGYAVLREVLVKGLLAGAAGAITGGLAYLADYLWPLVDGQNRALHDFIVDSRVVLSDSRRA
jgi:uncharacterized RDD family membrane protein YckC